jgi:hypothetical protein
MEKHIRSKIREMIQLINDDALFKTRDIPGDQDEFEQKSVIDVDQVKYDLYCAINDLIAVYDRLETPESVGQCAEPIKKIKELTDNLNNVIQ